MDQNMSLTAFLLARLDEDEAVAGAIAPSVSAQWELDREEHCVVGPCGVIAELNLGGVAGPHIVRWQPERVLAECEAKRRIMARHHRTDANHWSGEGNCEGCGFYGPMDISVTDCDTECPELRDLAAVYSNHPDYDEAWAI